MSSEPLGDSADGPIVQNVEELCGQRRQLDICWDPQLQLHVAVLPPHYGSVKENLCNQQRNSRAEQKDPATPQIKEEHEDLFISQDEEQLDLKQEIKTLMEIPIYKAAGVAAEEQAQVLEPANIHIPPPPLKAEGTSLNQTITTCDQQQQKQEATPPTPTSAKGKSRGRKGKEKGATAAKPKKNWSIEEKVEEEILKWLQANPYLWMRSKKGYKRKKAAWEMKAAELGISEGHLECWWKGVKDWHVKLIKKTRGQATKMPTERENWVLKNVAFYKSSIPKKGGDPRVPSDPQQSQSSQASAAVSRPPDSDQELEARGSHLPEEMKTTAMPSTQTSSSSGQRNKRQRGEPCLEEEDAWMAELRSTMKATQALLEKLIEERPVHTEREAFIRFVSDTLRTVPEKDYADMKNLILDIVSGRRQQPAQPQPSTSWSRPEYRPSSQQPPQLLSQQFIQNLQQQHYFQPHNTHYTQS